MGILGALAGAAIEAGSQVVGAMATGSSFSDAVSNIDYADVGISALEYGAAGLTNGASLLVSDKFADAAKAAVDIKGNGEISTVVGGLNGGKTKDLGGAVTEFVVGKTLGAAFKKGGKVVGEKVNNALDKTIKKQTSNLTAKSKNLTKANNSVANGNANSKASTPSNALGEFSVAKDKVLTTKQVKNAANSDATKKTVKIVESSTGSAANEKIKQLKEEE